MTPIDTLGIEMARAVKVWSDSLRKAFERAAAEDSRLRGMLEQTRSTQRNSNGNDGRTDAQD